VAAAAETIERAAVWVVIPALDAAATIVEVVRPLVAAGWRVLVVDDGSRDETGALAAAEGVRVLRHVVNLGQGAALQTGIDHAVAAGAEAIVTFDADGQHDPEDVRVLVAALEPGIDVALGSRFKGQAIGMPAARRLLLRGAIHVSNALSGLKLSDTHCGLRAIRATAAPCLRLTQDRMAHASEVLERIRSHHIPFVEVPVKVSYPEQARRSGQHGLNSLRILFDYVLKRAANEEAR
jgi:glycosyltransferase involved in cell wall biosynthesis